QDDWTTGSSQLEPGQASPRDNVVFEAGLFGGVLGMRRTFILHASGAKLPTDLLGLTCVRYADTLTPSEMRTATRKFATQLRTNFALLVSTAHGGLVDGAHRKGAFCSKPLEDFARSQWRA
ncbi:MAG: TIR domain-containing protein, partial [Pseudolabrys sp.]